MYKRISYTERLYLERWFDEGKSPKEIASLLGRHISTIYRELKRGAYERLNSDWTTSVKYSATIAQDAAEYNASNHGSDLKIASDHALAAYIEEKILAGWSPDMVTGRLRLEGSTLTDICTSTLYSYIHKGIFLNISDKNLRSGAKKKRSGRKRAAKAPAGTSIEKRPEEINSRNSFGHWEMDSVVGDGKKGEVLLVLTERLTRNEHMIKMPDKSSCSTVNALRRLRRRYGKSFYHIFKSITVDNGSEFAREIFESVRSPLKDRIPVYYCHPYSAYERGSNENANILIRRYIPKGDRLENHSHAAIAGYQKQINDMPRKILGYYTAAECFARECAALAGQLADDHEETAECFARECAALL